MIDLDEADHLVGVAQFDDTSLGLAVCGNYADPDIERILSLEADVVLTEAAPPGGPSGSGVPARLRELQAAGVLRVVAVPQIRSIAGVGAALTDPGYGLGVLLGVEAEAAEIWRRMEQRLASVSAAVAGRSRPRVVMFLSTEPMGAIGPGVTHDRLLQMAGGENALADAGVGYVPLDRQMLIDQIRPDVIFLISPGAPPLAEDDPRLRPFAGLPIRAVSQRRIFLITHPQAQLPSTSLPETLAEMAKALHPECADAIDAALEAGGGGGSGGGGHAAAATASPSAVGRP